MMNKKEWLNSPFPQDHCPYCGETDNIHFEREDDGTDVYYRADCFQCGKSWGQQYHLVFDYNFEDEVLTTG
jgi:Zn ribbon nucleic-acid-binding protein